MFKKLIENLKIFSRKKEFKNLTLNDLPSMGYFYDDNFKVHISKATEEDIENFKENYKPDTLNSLFSISEVVQKNILLPKGYSYKHLSSIDVVFIFFEIVRFTKEEPIYINLPSYSVEFTPNNFKYFDVNEELKKFYNKDKKAFIIDGYSYSIPSIGVENSITKFLTICYYNNELDKYSDKNYDFLFFLNKRVELTTKEIINLIEIFNDDMEDEEVEKVKNIINMFEDFTTYRLYNKNGSIIKMNNLNLERVWD